MFGDYHLWVIYILSGGARKLIGNHFFYFIPFHRINSDKTNTQNKHP